MVISAMSCVRIFYRSCQKSTNRNPHTGDGGFWLAEVKWLVRLSNFLPVVCATNEIASFSLSFFWLEKICWIIKLSDFLLVICVTNSITPFLSIWILIGGNNQISYLHRSFSSNQVSGVNTVFSRSPNWLRFSVFRFPSFSLLLQLHVARNEEAW